MQLPEELRAQALIELQNAERLGGPTSAMNRLSRFYLIVFFILVRPVMKEEEEAWEEDKVDGEKKEIFWKKDKITLINYIVNILLKFSRPSD